MHTLDEIHDARMSSTGRLSAAACSDWLRAARRMGYARRGAARSMPGAVLLPAQGKNPW